MGLSRPAAVLASLILLVSFGCHPRLEVKPLPTDKREAPTRLSPLGYTIQVGAFSLVENALRMTDTLRKLGIEAYYFRHESGLYKVRFGEFTLRKRAQSEAEELVSRNVIEEFYIVNPQYSTSPVDTASISPSIRSSLVDTALEYRGLPYCWGGTTPEEGFDCSGLALAVYRLHGFKLPRTSREQFSIGIPVTRDDLEPGDLVFFATRGGRRVSHVGIYIGDGHFIHAPAVNKNIRIDALDSRYYRMRYLGARRYVY